MIRTIIRNDRDNGFNPFKFIMLIKTMYFILVNIDILSVCRKRMSSLSMSMLHQ